MEHWFSVNILHAKPFKEVVFEELVLWPSFISDSNILDRLILEDQLWQIWVGAAIKKLHLVCGRESYVSLTEVGIFTWGKITKVVYRSGRFVPWAG